MEHPRRRQIGQLAHVLEQEIAGHPAPFIGQLAPRRCEQLPRAQGRDDLFPCMLAELRLDGGPRIGHPISQRDQRTMLAPLGRERPALEPRLVAEVRHDVQTFERGLPVVPELVRRQILLDLVRKLLAGVVIEQPLCRDHVAEGKLAAPPRADPAHRNAAWPERKNQRQQRMGRRGRSHVR